jgi:hemoglobin-like flavoprotein
MTPRQIDLVQSSFEDVRPIADTAASLFYRRLFELDPSLRSLFRTNMEEQGRKLMDTLGVIVGHLRWLDRIMPGIRALGARHMQYGVKDSDYPVVGQALIDTLQIGLGAGFTAEVSEAWLAAYTLLAKAMTSEAEEEAEAVAS